MAVDVRVARKLEFRAGTTQLRMGREAVVRGRQQEAMAHFFDDFDADTIPLSTTQGSFWAAETANGGVTPAIVVGANGLVNIATTANNLDVTEVYGQKIWYPRQGLTFEARLNLAAITTINVAFGLVDEASKTDDMTAFFVAAGGGPTVKTGITDAACFVFDTAMTTAKWVAATSIAAAAAQGGTITSAVAPAGGTFETFRIHIDTLGNATFWRNGLRERTIAAAVTNTAALRPYLAVATRTTAAKKIYVDYVECWQDRRESSSVLW